MPRMAMGIRETEQSPLWVVTSDLPKSPAHPCYAQLNARLDANDFDKFVEKKCQAFYAPVMGRPSLAPGVVGSIHDSKAVQPGSDRLRPAARARRGPELARSGRLRRIG